MSNILIVESDNDRYFIEALINHLNLSIKIGEPICSVDEYECLGGINNLEHKLIELKSIVSKDGIEKIGIIFDADEVGVEDRTKQIQEKIDLIFYGISDVSFNIYIINKDGKGELEDILKEIKTEESKFADCLSGWKYCLEQEGKEISDKVFNKFWINNYIMYDTCTSSKHRGKKSKYCVFEYAMKEKKIWNFEHEILNELKEFLKELGEENDNTTSN